MTTPILLILMLVACAVMVYGLVKHKDGKTWGNAVAVTGAVVALATVGMQLPVLIRGRSDPGMPRLQYIYARIAGVKLGKHLAAKYPKARALVILPPGFPALPDSESECLLDGVKEGLGGSPTIVAVVSPEIPKADVPLAQPPSRDTWMTVESFDRALASHAGSYDLLITTIGLPPKAEELQAWKLLPPPRMAIAGGQLTASMKTKIVAGAIVAATCRKPNAVLEVKAPPRNPDTAFDKLYLLITPENVAQMAKEYPELFEAEKDSKGKWGR